MTAAAQKREIAQSSPECASSITGRIGALAANRAYLRGGDVFNAFTGDAIFVGPTLYAQLGPKAFMTAAWNARKGADWNATHCASAVWKDAILHGWKVMLSETSADGGQASFTARCE